MNGPAREQGGVYTSMVSFWDLMKCPHMEKQDLKPPVFFPAADLVARIRTALKLRINADVNGALNIMRKCNIVSLSKNKDRLRAGGNSKINF